MIEVQRKENESTSSLIRRFTQRLQQSGNLMRVRAVQFKTRPKSSLSKKKKALERISRRKEMQRLYKLGKIK